MRGVTHSSLDGPSRGSSDRRRGRIPTSVPWPSASHWLPYALGADVATRNAALPPSLDSPTAAPEQLSVAALSTGQEWQSVWPPQGPRSSHPRGNGRRSGTRQLD